MNPQRQWNKKRIIPISVIAILLGFNAIAVNSPLKLSNLMGFKGNDAAGIDLPQESFFESLLLKKDDDSSKPPVESNENKEKNTTDS